MTTDQDKAVAAFREAALAKAEEIRKSGYPDYVARASKWPSLDAWGYETWKRFDEQFKTRLTYQAIHDNQ
jgi:hypothetical protein